MTLITIFAVLVLIGVLIAKYNIYSNPDSWFVAGAFGAVIFSISLIIAVLIFAMSKMDSEIKYEQLLKERENIVKTIENGEDLDEITMRDEIDILKIVCDYNNRVIADKVNSKRFIIGEYYSKDVDWEALETIGN